MAENGTVKVPVNRIPAPATTSVNWLPICTSAKPGPDQGKTLKERVIATPAAPLARKENPMGAAEKMDVVGPAVRDRPLLSSPPYAVPVTATLFARAGSETKLNEAKTIRAQKRGR